MDFEFHIEVPFQWARGSKPLSINLTYIMSSGLNNQNNGPLSPLEAYKTSQTSDSEKNDLRKLQNLSPKNSDQDFKSWESLSAYSHKGKTDVSHCNCK